MNETWPYHSGTPAMEKSELIQKAKEFARLDRECIELSYERARPQSDEELTEYLTELMTLCDKGFSLWNEIRIGLGELTNVRMPDFNTREILRRVRDGDDFFLIRQYRTLADLLNTTIEEIHGQYPTSTEDFIREKWDELFQEFHSWFDVSEYYSRKAQVGCIVVTHHPNKTIDGYYSEIRDAYAFGLKKACIALCRGLIELVLHDTLLQRRKLGQPRAVDISTGREPRFYLGYLINQAGRCGILARQGKERAIRVKNEAEKVLHLRDRGTSSQIDLDDRIAFELIGDTVRVIEEALSG